VRTAELVQLLQPHLDAKGLLSDAKSLEVFSKDAYDFSPILKAELSDKRADIIVAPQTIEQLQTVVRLAVKHGIPLSVRGAGTGNYGQSVPLCGGIMVSTHRLNKTISLDAANGIAHVQAGVRMGTLERQARAVGWELRCYPSTYATATVSGFIGGGFGGVGSIRHGTIWDGYLKSVTLLEITPEAHLHHLEGPGLFGVIHAYGTSGIMVELEVNLAPAVAWEELVICFPTLESGLRFAYGLAGDPGLSKREISVHGWPIPSYFAPLVKEGAIAEGQTALLLELAEGSSVGVARQARELGGALTWQAASSLYHKGRIALSDFCWNHTTLWAMKTDSSWTYLQSLFHTAPDQALAQVRALGQHHGSDTAFHGEYFLQGGELKLAALELLRYRGIASVREAVELRESLDVHVADPHTYRLDGDARWQGRPVLEAKARYNPQGLLSTGKVSEEALIRPDSWGR
jgi:FAD/FMN-containing dehydrogenase